MKQLIITSGNKYTDIDAYACAIAYKELCDLKNISALVVLPGPMNESVTASVRNIKAEFQTTLVGNPQDYGYVLVDISEPKHFSNFVIEENIVELYDHRWGFEKYWQEKLGEKAKINQVGACATLIWQEFWNAKVEEKISQESALLLYTAIISNTLNLNAQITHDLDRQAVKELHHYAQLPEKWVEQYYEEASSAVLSNPEKAMRNDTKILEAGGEKYGIIQTELWESESFIKTNYQLILTILKSLESPHTFLTAPNIAHDFNYLVTEDELVKTQLTNKIDAIFEGDIGKTKKLWLRKEIIKALS